MKVFGKTSGLMLSNPFSRRTIIIVGQNMVIMTIGKEEKKSIGVILDPVLAGFIFKD